MTQKRQGWLFSVNEFAKNGRGESRCEQKTHCKAVHDKMGECKSMKRRRKEKFGKNELGSAHTEWDYIRMMKVVRSYLLSYLNNAHLVKSEERTK